MRNARVYIQGQASCLAAGAALLLALAGCSGSGGSESDNSGTTTGSAAGGSAGVTSGGKAAASTSGGSSAKARIILVTNGFSPFWDSLQKGMHDAAATYDVTADWVGPPHAQVEEQKDLMKNKAESGCDGMGVSAIEAQAITPVIDELAGRGIQMLTFDSDAPKSKRLIYIGTDNFESGQEVGKALVSLLPGGGNVYGFVGNISAENARERRDGFLDAIKGHNINLVSVLEDQKDPSVARQNVENILQAHPGQVQALLGFYSYNLPAIVTAVKNAGIREKVKIVGFDAEPATLQALGARPALIDATVVQKPYEFGRLSVEFLYLAHKDGPDKARQEWNGLNSDYPLKGDKINTGVRVITPQNIGPFMEQLKKWGVTSS